MIGGMDKWCMGLVTILGSRGLGVRKHSPVRVMRGVGKTFIYFQERAVATHPLYLKSRVDVQTTGAELDEARHLFTH